MQSAVPPETPADAPSQAISAEAPHVIPAAEPAAVVEHAALEASRPAHAPNPSPAAIAPAAAATAGQPEARHESRAVASPNRAISLSPAILDLPPVTLNLPPESGLVLIETSHRDTAPPEPDTKALPPPRRARRQRVPLPEEPLQIVETRKDQPPAS
jgi:hypothetical protein